MNIQLKNTNSLERLLEWDLRCKSEKDENIRPLGVQQLKNWLKNYVHLSDKINDVEKSEVLKKVNGITKNQYKDKQIESNLRKMAQKYKNLETTTINIDMQAEVESINDNQRKKLVKSMKNQNLSLQNVADNLKKLYGKNNNVSDAGRNALEEQLKNKLEMLEDYCDNTDCYQDKSNQNKIDKVSSDLSAGNLDQLYKIAKQNCTSDSGKESLKNIGILIDKIQDFNNEEVRDEYYIESLSEGIKYKIELIEVEYDKTLKKYFDAPLGKREVHKNRIDKLLSASNKLVNHFEKELEKYGVENEHIQKNLQRMHAENFFMQLKKDDEFLNSLDILSSNTEDLYEAIHQESLNHPCFITATKEFTEARKFAKQNIDFIECNFDDAKTILKRLKLFTTDKEVISKATNNLNDLKQFRDLAQKDYLYACLKSSISVLKKFHENESHIVVIFRDEDYLGEPKKYSDEKAITRLYNEITNLTTEHKKINNNEISERFALKLLEGMDLLNFISLSHNDFKTFSFGVNGQKLIIDCLNVCIRKCMESESFKNLVKNSNFLHVNSKKSHLTNRLYKNEWWSGTNKDIIQGFKELQSVL